MMRRPNLPTPRAAAVYSDMLLLRRELYGDNDFFKMNDVWETLCGDFEQWEIKLYRTNETADYRRKAGVIVFEDRLTLMADERLFANAKRGCKFSNFILAHELGHWALDHHARSAVVKNFQLFAGPCGMSNIPPTQEELEANLAAVFFQCGAALADQSWTPLELAKRAYSDPSYVKKAQDYVRLDVFQRELNRTKPSYPRVVL